MKIKTAIDLYLANKSAATRTTYLQAWGEWERFTGVRSRCATLKDSAKYLGSLRCADNTKRKKLAILRVLYSVFLDLRIVDQNPFSQAARFLSARRRQQVRPTKRVSVEDVRKLLNAKPKRGFRTKRDRAMMAVMFGCGLRRSELARLVLSDIQTSQDGILFLRLRDTKAGVEQEQPVPNWTWELLTAYIAERSGQGSAGSDPMFGVRIKSGWRAMSVSNIYKMFVGYCRDLGLEPGTAPHAARATAATQLLISGEPQDSVQRFLRHKTPQMVAAYDKRRVSLAQNPGRKLAY
jgi:integrase/recombinase XerD